MAPRLWLLVAAASNALAAQPEKVSDDIAGPMIPKRAPSRRDMTRIGGLLGQGASTAILFVVLETPDRDAQARPPFHFFSVQAVLIQAAVRRVVRAPPPKTRTAPRRAGGAPFAREGQ